MKTVIILVLVGITIVSCNEEGCTDPTATNYSNKANKDDGSCVYTPGSQNNDNDNAILFNGNFNYVDYNNQFNFPGITNYISAIIDNDEQLAAQLYEGDSILQIKFKQKDNASNRWITIRLETHGAPISTGSYSFSTNPMNYRVSVVVGSDTDEWHTHSNADPIYNYNGSPVIKTGTLIIDEFTSTSISGTLNGNLYGELNGNTGTFASKLIINNGTFSCKMD